MTNSIQFDGLRIELQQTAKSIDGLVHFPEAFKRSSVAIACRVADVVPSTTRPAAARPGRRERAVQAYRDAIAADPGGKRGPIAKRVAAAFGCSARAIQMWVRKASLGDTLVKPSRNAIDGDDDNIEPAIRVCAYWCFRIGNLPTIDTRHVMLALDTVRKHNLEDILAVIDFYYSYDCNRDRFPFKKLSNWLRYEFDKWLYRARHASANRQARAAADRPKHFVKTGPPATDPVEAMRARRRDVRCDGHWICPEPPSPTFDLTAVGRAAHQASRMGLPDVVDALTRSLAGTEPTTIDQALQGMPDGFRVMLLNASKNDSNARREAIATQAVWFDQLPQSVRNNATFMVDAWIKEHVGSTQGQADARRVDIVLQAIRRRTCGRDPALLSSQPL